MKQLIWISYDLGIDGDYESLYHWLDSKSARECGDNIAVLSYEYSNSLLSDIKRDLKKSVGLRDKDRVYIIYRDKKTKLLKGKFIVGKRKLAPWKGYSGVISEDIEDEG